MSERARDFVECWKKEQLPPAADVDDALAQSAGLAETCYEAAAAAGISKEEIDREYDDLASDIAAALEARVATQEEMDPAANPDDRRAKRP